MRNRHPHQLLADSIASALAQLYEQVQRCFQQADGGSDGIGGIESSDSSDNLLLHGSVRNLLGLSSWSENKHLHQQLLLLEQLSRALVSDSPAARERVLPHVLSLLLRLNEAPQVELAARLRQRLDLLDARPGSWIQEPQRAQADLLQTLRGVRPFLPQADAHALTPYLDAGTQPGLEQLLQQRVQALATACSRSDWTLQDYVHSGMAAQSRVLTQLGNYAGTHYRAALHQLDVALLRLHVRGQRPAPAVQQQLLVHISGLALGKVPAEPVLAALMSPQSASSLVLDAATLTLLHVELGGYIEQLQQELTLAAADNARRVSERLLLVFGKLVWVLQAVGQTLLGELAQCLHQVSRQYWALRLPLPMQASELCTSFRHLLERLLQQPQQPCEAVATTYALMSAVLLQWPDSMGLPVQQVSLRSSDGSGWQTLPVSVVPDYLAAAAAVLVAAKAEWFTDAAQFAQRAVQLQQALQMLEQDMAAINMQVVAEFSALLLDVYTHVRLPVSSAALPGPLLWQAQQQLIAMLDRAAAGFDPVPDPAISSALTDWLTQADANLAQAMGSAPADPRWLELKLAYLLRQRSKQLGRPLRLCLQADNACGHALAIRQLRQCDVAGSPGANPV